MLGLIKERRSEAHESKVGWKLTDKVTALFSGRYPWDFILGRKPYRHLQSNTNSAIAAALLHVSQSGMLEVYRALESNWEQHSAIVLVKNVCLLVMTYEIHSVGGTTCCVHSRVGTMV